MRYFGGKQRISKPLSEYLNSQLKENQPFVDLFCGSCNIVSRIDDNRLRIANDKHKYLIDMWMGIKDGYKLPNELSEEEYKYIRNNKDEDPILTGFVGFGCSYSGKWFGGYCRDNTGRNYCLNAKKSTLKKIKKLQDVEFTNLNYTDVNIPKGSLVYCDIPYENTTPYCKSEVGEFNHDEFYEWVRTKSEIYDIYISGYKENVPKDFKIVWEHESKKDIRNKNGIQEKTIEVLMKYY